MIPLAVPKPRKWRVTIWHPEMPDASVTNVAAPTPHIASAAAQDAFSRATGRNLAEIAKLTVEQVT